MILDEGFIIVTEDIVKSFLNRANKTLLCHPSGSQSLGMWLKDVPGLQTFGDNKRIFHHQIDFSRTVGKSRDICRTALAIHQSYPKKMKTYWDIYLKLDNRSYILPPIAFPCDFPQVYDYRVARGIWFAVPKLCKDLPVWNRGEYFKGRARKQLRGN